MKSLFSLLFRWLFRQGLNLNNGGYISINNMMNNYVFYEKFTWIIKNKIKN